jgi:uncharacterized protein YfdQ (DUF2303 family)
MAEKTEAEQVRDIERATSPIHSVGDDKKIAIVPMGYQVHDLEKYLDEPTRLRANRVFHDVASFIEYCDPHISRDESILLADKDKTTFSIIFDYRGWKEHTAKYACPLSDEWKRWKDQSGKQTTQQQFAQFIEDNLPDVIKPEGAAMLEISRTLEAKKNVNFISNTRLNNGTVDFVFEEKIEATAQKGDIKIPEIFVIGIPVFTNGELFEINAKLRYRLDSGKLSIWYELERPHKVQDAAFQKVRKEIEEGLKVKALMGEV